MAEPQEGLTEEWLKLEDDILSIVAAYGSEVLARRDTKVGLVTLTAEARNEIAAKLRTLGYSSPQEVKDMCKDCTAIDWAAKHPYLSENIKEVHSD